LLGEWLAGGEVGEGSKSGEGVADAEEEVAVAEVPKVLGVVVQVPGGAGEGVAGGKFDEECLDDAILIVFGLVRQARYEAVNDEGEKKMLVVDVMQREHRAAVEQELGGERLEAEVFERDAERWLGLCGEDGSGSKKKTGQCGTEMTVQCRNGGMGNRHGTGRVSLHYRQRVSVMFHRRGSDGNVCNCDGHHGGPDGAGDTKAG
jgi:hypothetical protein